MRKSHEDGSDRRLAGKEPGLLVKRLPRGARVLQKQNAFQEN